MIEPMDLATVPESVTVTTMSPLLVANDIQRGQFSSLLPGSIIEDPNTGDADSECGLLEESPHPQQDAGSPSIHVVELDPEEFRKFDSAAAGGVNVSLHDVTDTRSWQDQGGADRFIQMNYVTDTVSGNVVVTPVLTKEVKDETVLKHPAEYLQAFACPDCAYTTSRSSNLARHQLTHHGDKNFACPHCKKMFSQKIHMQRHILYKHKEKSVHCQYCDYVCSSYNPDLKLHMRRKHVMHCKDHMGDLQDLEVSLSCELCEFKASSRHDLLQHMKYHKTGPELKIYCEKCSFVTDCESRYKRHVLVHSKEKPYVCPECPYKASQREHVKRHMLVIHGVTVNRPYSRRRTVRREAGKLTTYSMHSRSAMNDDPTILVLAANTQTSIAGTCCSLCDVTFNSESELQLHLGSHHAATTLPLLPRLTGAAQGRRKGHQAPPADRIKMFHCSHCTMSFSKMLNLYKHLQIQHGISSPGYDNGQHTCLMCDYETNRKSNLLIHMRKHNPDSLAAPPRHRELFHCFLCDYVSQNRASLLQHMTKTHALEVSENQTAMTTVSAPGDSGEENTVVVVGLPDHLPPHRAIQPTTPQHRLITIPDKHTAVKQGGLCEEAANAAEGLTALSQQYRVSVQALAQDDVVLLAQSDEDKTSDEQIDIINITDKNNTELTYIEKLAKDGFIIVPDNHNDLISELVMLPKLDRTLGIKIDTMPKLVAENSMALKSAADNETSLELAIGNDAMPKIMMENDMLPQLVVDNDMSSNLASEDETMPQIATEAADLVEDNAEKSDVLTEKQVVQLSDGDYVEINGELYKIEYST